MAARKRSGTPRAAAASPAPRRSPELPPWLTEAGARLRQREAGGRLPHALLIAGPPGMGKRLFARWFAQSLLCHAPSESGACQRCPSCSQWLVEAHPDYRELLPDGVGIKVDAVRALLGWQQMAAPAGRWRVALLDGADTLNRNAANALLKTLEEPAAGALLLLVADRPARLPATVRSRCQSVLLGDADAALAQAWLHEQAKARGLGDIVPAALLARASGAPLAALALAEPAAIAARELIDKAWLDAFLMRGSVGRISDSLSELDTRTCLAAFSRLCALALRQRAGLPAGPDPAEQAVVSQVADRLNDEQWFTVRDRLQRLHRIDGPSFKTQTVLEGLFADIRLTLTGQVSE